MYLDAVITKKKKKKKKKRIFSVGFWRSSDLLQLDNV